MVEIRLCRAQMSNQLRLCFCMSFAVQITITIIILLKKADDDEEEEEEENKNTRLFAKQLLLMNRFVVVRQLLSLTTLTKCIQHHRLPSEERERRKRF